MSLLPSLAIVFPVLVTLTGVAQASVDCLPQYQWAYNRQNKSPCDVASGLLDECNSAAGPLLPLPSGGHGEYYDPYNSYPTSCMCNTVTYSLISACGLCQGQTFLYWHQWAEVCDNATIGYWLYSFPDPLPPGLDVPAWAYMDVTTTDYFQLDLAFQNATSSERQTGTQTQVFSTPSVALPTTGPGPSSSAGGTSISNSNITYNMVPASSASDLSGGKGSKSGGLDVGALIGAITGAVSGLVIVVLSILRYMAFRKNQIAKKKLQDEENHGLVSLSPTPTHVDRKDSKYSKQEDDWDTQIELETDAHGETDFHLHA